MEINVDPKHKKFFNKTGTYIKEYRLFIKKGDTGEKASIEENELLVVIDTDSTYYALKDYGYGQYIVEVYKRNTDGLNTCVIDEAYAVERGGFYDHKEGIEVCLYSTTSIKSSRQKMLKCLRKYVDDNRWKIDVDLSKIQNIIECGLQ